jgi:hypothetical protein
VYRNFCFDTLLNKINLETAEVTHFVENMKCKIYCFVHLSGIRPSDLFRFRIHSKTINHLDVWKNFLGGGSNQRKGTQETMLVSLMPPAGYGLLTPLLRSRSHCDSITFTLKLKVIRNARSHNIVFELHVVVLIIRIKDIMLKITVFRVVAPCGLVETDRRSSGAYCLHYQGLGRLASA